MKKLTLIGMTFTFLLGLALWQQQLFVAQAAPTSLAPIVIDDFNTGAFFIADNETVNDLPASGAIGGSRDATVDETLTHNTLYGYLRLDLGTNYLFVQPGVFGGNYSVAWGNNTLLGGSDLNLNASGYDRLVVTLSSAANAGTLTVRFNSSGSPSASLPITGPGDYAFLFSSPSLVSLNTADIDGITLSFTNGSASLVESVTITAPTPTCIVDPVVTTNADSGAGSLRQAIIDACPGSTITFDTAGEFSTPQTITLTSGELVIDKSLTIDGPGASQLTVSGNNASRVFYISRMSPNTIVTLDGLTVTGGNGIGAGDGVDESGAGGGIFNDRTGSTSGMLTLTNCTVSGNSATHGGGIYSNNNTLTIINSTVSANSVGDDGIGGGIKNFGTLMVINSTVSGNSSGGGGGIFSSYQLTLTHSTVSGNSTPNKGGGIFNDGTARLINSTVSGNSADQGGGIWHIGLGGPMTITNSTITGNRADPDGNGEGTGGGLLTNVQTLNNTIIAGNFLGTGTTPNDIGFGGNTTANNNLIGDAATSGSITNDVNGNKVGNSGAGTLDINTVLDTTLANNGGPTLTHRLKSGSPAIDAGSNALALDASNVALTTDQRGAGFPRTRDGNGDSTVVVDIGAFEEVEPVSITVTTSPAGLSFTVDGNPYTSPQTFNWTPSSNHTIAATSPQSLVLGTQYVFLNWSDAGAISHGVTAPASPTTYTATFKTQHQLTTSAGAGGAISPASGFYDQGNVVITATANAGFTFTGFSGALTGTTNPQTLNLTGPASVTANFVTTNGCGITINPATLPQPYLDVPYLRILSAAPAGSYSFSVSGGQLPPGLQLVTVLGVSSIIGLPGAPGTYSFTIKAKKNNSTCEATRSYTVTIAPTIVPILNCVQRNQNGTYTARFGYKNSTGAAVTIPVGANNYFTPGNQNRGQITLFQAGNVTNAFSVTFSKGNNGNLAIWFLKGPDGVLRPVNVLTTSIGCP